MSTKQAAVTTGLFTQIDSGLYTAFVQKCAKLKTSSTRIVEELIAKWLRVKTPDRPGRGRPKKKVEES